MNIINVDSETVLYCLNEGTVAGKKMADCRRKFVLYTDDTILGLYYRDFNIGTTTKRKLDRMVSLNKECYICLQNFTRNKNVRQLPCEHIFCEECLKPWLKKNSICPICKYELKHENKNEDEEEDNDNYDF